MGKGGGKGSKGGGKGGKMVGGKSGSKGGGKGKGKGKGKGSKGGEKGGKGGKGGKKGSKSMIEGEESLRGARKDRRKQERLEKKAKKNAFSHRFDKVNEARRAEKAGEVTPPTPPSPAPTKAKKRKLPPAKKDDDADAPPAAKKTRFNAEEDVAKPKKLKKHVAAAAAAAAGDAPRSCLKGSRAAQAEEVEAEVESEAVESEEEDITVLAPPVTTPTPAPEEPKAKAYVPPALRARMGAASTPLEKARLKIKSELNKISLNNIQVVAKGLVDLREGQAEGMSISKAEFEEVFCTGVIESVCDVIRLVSGFVFPYAALVKIVAAMTSDSLGATMFHNLCRALEAAIEGGHRNKAINAILLIVHLHSLSVTDSLLVYSLIKHLSRDISSELHSELLLVLVAVGGEQLRKENINALKDVTSYVQRRYEHCLLTGAFAGDAAAAAPAADGEDAAAAQPVSVRGKILLDLLFSLRSSKVQKTFGQESRQIDHAVKERTAKTVGETFAAMKIKHPTVHRLTWSLVMKEAHVGMWWMNIAKGVSKEDEGGDDEANSDSGSEYDEEEEEEEEDEEEEEVAEAEETKEKRSIDALTASHRCLNSPTRRAVFKCIVSSDDSLHCMHQLSALALKPEQEKDVAMVLLYCLVKEKTYNPYYFKVLRTFAVSHRRWRFTLMFALWDRWASIADEDLKLHQCINLSVLFACLVADKKISIAGLKGVDFTKKKMTPSMSTCMRVQLLCLCIAMNGSSLNQIFAGTLARTLDLETLRGTMQKWIETTFLHDAVERVSFVSKILPVLLPAMGEHTDLPEGLEAQVKAVCSRIKSVHQSLNQQLDIPE